MFQTAMGISVPDSSRIREEYLLSGNNITANLSFEKLARFVHDFYHLLPEPLFLAVHPDAEKEEVWYLDNCTAAQLDTILDGFGELLYQDGLSAFAIGSLANDAELFVERYKILSIYAPSIKPVCRLLEQNGVTAAKQLTTVWDTFTDDEPGEVTKLEIGGMTIEDMIEELRQLGMYRA